MGRLIDADVLIEALKNEPSYSIELPANIGDSIQKLLAVHQKMVVDVVKKQPTAYDVDAVVAELEYQKEKCEEDMEYWQQKSWKDNVAYTNWDLCDRKSDCLEEAIDIVKRGGVE